jgi:hypothetical protein
MAAELSLPEADGIARLLMKRPRRGVIFFGTLQIVSSLAFAIGLIAGQYFGAVGSFFAAILFGLGLDHVKKKRTAALLVVRDPQMVYWAHPTRVTQAMSRHLVANIAPLTVHLRNGEQFEATLAPSEQKQFVEWLSRVNTSMRWGPYDDVPASNQG